ncbi:hypothetical protein ACGFZB_35510 [Streptomyces cinerochromogenes]|uniref:HPr kinase n=1 Tax=Streptomyces cinerochromogenes TaxID=66422 RepID=A0ABW7BEK5_9ACTN
MLKIVTDTDGPGALLSDTFYPSGVLGVVDAGGGQEADMTVVDLTCHPDDINAWLRQMAVGTRKAEYELTRDYWLPRFDSDAFSVFTLKDVHSDEVAALVKTDRRFTIVHPQSVLGDRWLTRVIRDIATRIAKAEGSLVMHSSAFVFEGGAYLVIGDSGAGKSTTAIALSRLLPSAGWMGNDRIHLDWQAGYYSVTACPLPLGINKGSLDVMGVTGFEDWSVRAGHPGPESDWDQFRGEDKLKLSSREVSRYLGVPVTANATLAGVILPQVDLDAEYFLEPATLDHAALVLGRNCFSIEDSLYGADWLGVSVGQQVAPPSIDTFLGSIVGLPLLRCSVGTAADVLKLADDFQGIVRG